MLLLRKIAISINFIAWILIVVTLCSCATSSSSDSRIELSGRVSAIKVLSLQSMKTKDEMKVQVRIQNSSSSLIDIFYRCKFIESNPKVFTYSDWLRVEVPPTQITELTCKSNSPAVDDFIIEVNRSGSSEVKVYESVSDNLKKVGEVVIKHAVTSAVGLP